MPVHGSLKGICSLLTEHHDDRMKCHCSHLHLLNFNIYTYRLSAGGPKIIISYGQLMRQLKIFLFGME